MATDRLLTTLLGLFQNVHDAPKTDQILGTTVSLLATLTNPLNISLLTSHFLSAHAIWHPHVSPSQTCLRVMSVFSTAALRVRTAEVDGRLSHTIHGSEGWARAVALGADDRSARWQHLLCLTGVLTGFEGSHRQSLSPTMRRTLEDAVARAASIALTDAKETNTPEPTRTAVALALTYAFPLLSEQARASIDTDALVPAALESMFGIEGLDGGMFIGANVNNDLRVDGLGLLEWPQTSPSFVGLQRVSSQPLVRSLGPLAKMAAYAIENAKSLQLVLYAQDRLLSFSTQLMQHWRANRLSQLEPLDAPAHLTQQTAQSTWPIMLQTQKNIMFACAFVLQAVVSRALLDSRISSHLRLATTTASKTLLILRNLHFISSRPGNSAFQVYSFIYLGSVDILTKDGGACVELLRQTFPPSASIGQVPLNALDRVLDLFYLSLAEHLPLCLTPDACEAFIVRPAMVYISPASSRAMPTVRILELFEAAHSAVLSVLCCPQNAPLTVKLVPTYAEILFESFPRRISARQFRMAAKTIMQIISPPFPISATHPELAETLLEMMRFRADATAAKIPLPPGPEESAAALAAQESGEPAAAAAPMSEQTALVLAMIDSLPFLPLAIVEDWLTVAAISLNKVEDAELREVVKQRFWDVLVSGEMDVERAALGVAWWGTKGGREMVLFGPAHDPTRPAPFLMSGAIVDEVERGSKL
ncbi:hypothetical protein PspLS_01985 [Pyricularia sp. CBS 133598]|nr:hypothetical protein PspLS_01985 [Pyricularia sp. CBS 133598]